MLFTQLLCQSEKERPARLLVVANRLPMSVNKCDSGDWSLKMSSGGLVSALLGVKNMDMTWIGWPGAEIATKDDQIAVKVLINEKNCEPVFLTRDLIDLYYSGYSNKIIWPLFHYIALPIRDLQHSDRMFDAYETANQLFANAILRVRYVLLQDSDFSNCLDIPSRRYCLGP